MNKCFSILFSLFTIILPLSAEYPIGIGDECVKENSLLLSKAFIDYIGLDDFTKLVEEHHMAIICTLDSVGNLQEILDIRSKFDIPEDLKIDFLFYCKSHNVRLKICYEKLLGHTIDSSINIWKKRISGKDSIGIVVGIPDLSWRITYQEYKHNGGEMSIGDYLLRQIELYNVNPYFE